MEVANAIYISDVIYGNIEIPSYCEDFINSWQFQRLRDISQLGNTKYVRASARHTRFEHCIGVMHLSGEFFKSLINNSSEKYQGYAKYVKYIHIAGLFHDIGHGPVSHLFEEILKNKDIPFNHEEFSTRILYDVNSEIQALDDKEVAIVASMILGQYMDRLPDFLFEIVNNNLNDLDIDKVDYLQRDSFYVNMPQIKISHIMSRAVIIGGHVGFDELGDATLPCKREITDLFDNRRLMYEQVYFDPRVVTIDRAFICAATNVSFTDRPNWEYMTEMDMNQLIFRNNNHDVTRCGVFGFSHYCDNCARLSMNREPKRSTKVGDPVSKILFQSTPPVRRA